MVLDRQMSKAIRPIRVEGDIAFVPLTRGYESVIDADDAHLVAGWNWYAMVRPRTVYACRIVWIGNGKWQSVLLHRALMDGPDGMEVDHINSDGLDNRRANMRLATQAQNTHNRRLARNNTSGIKGISLHKARGKWQAEIKINGKQHYLGQFANIEDARAAYAAASAAMHGEFGRTS